MRRLPLFLFLVLALLARPGATHGGVLADLEIANALQQQLFSPPSHIDKEPLAAATTVVAFYRQRAYLPYWSQQGMLTPEAVALLDDLQRAADDGLEPDNYHFTPLKQTLAEGFSAFDITAICRLELLLSDAFFHLAHDLQGGDGVRRDATWRLPPPPPLPENELFTALRREEPRALLQKLRPQHPDYAALRNALRDYRQIAAAGGWPLLGEEVQRTQEGETIRHLRQRLALSHDLATAEGPDHLDIDLRRAIRHFQRRHGLPPSGDIDAATLAELNIPVEMRIAGIIANLERWRQIPLTEFPVRYLLVNIPDYRLELIDHGRPRIEMRVVVGRPERPTPVMSGTMTHLVLNPYWEIPPSIAAEDIWPRLVGNPDYARRQGYHVLRGWDDDDEIAPELLTPQEVDEENFPYRLRQDPGPANALGQVKFIFPNNDNIYLHDTPERSHFSALRRDFSSGCVRVEEPLDLAAALLAEAPGLSRRGLERRLTQVTNQEIPLKTPLQVYLFYWTAFVDRKGELQFRQDPYGRDRGRRSTPPPEVGLQQRLPQRKLF